MNPESGIPTSTIEDTIEDAEENFSSDSGPGSESDHESRHMDHLSSNSNPPSPCSTDSYDYNEDDDFTYKTLYEGCRMTIRSYVINVMQMIRRHRLPITVLNGVLSLVNDILPENHNAPKNRYEFDKTTSTMIKRRMIVKKRLRFCESCSQRMDGESCNNCSASKFNTG